MIRVSPREPSPAAAAVDDVVGRALQPLRDVFGDDVVFHPLSGPESARAHRNGRRTSNGQPGGAAGRDGHGPLPALEGVPRRLLEAVVRDAASKPAARELEDGRVLLGMPVVVNDRRLGVAAAVTSLGRGALVCRLAEAALSLHEVRGEIEERNVQLRLFAEHLSRSLEEVTWLRSLAESLDCCTAGNGLAEVATTTFPALREVLQAEAVALVTRPLERSPSRVAPESLEFPAWFGEPVLSRSHCREFVACVAAGAKNRPFVWNFGGIPRSGRQFSGHVRQEVRACILAEVRDAVQHYGWILVLNRVGPPSEIGDGRSGAALDGSAASHPSGGAAAVLGADEFGTVEATLVTSAARLLATHATNIGLFRDQRHLTVSVIRSMINVLDARDRYTSGHSDRVAQSARTLADRLGLSVQEQEQIYLAGLLHDVGKVGIPDDVLLKPDRLTPDEFAIIKQHPQRGVDILKHIRQLGPMLPGVLHHHESWDGSGYPHGLAGESIPVMARVIAVADAFDAMTTCRPYRSARSVDDAVSVLRDGSRKQWDPRIVQVFLDHFNDVVQGSRNWESHIARILNPVDDLPDDLCGAVDDSVILSGANQRGQDSLFSPLNPPR